MSGSVNKVILVGNLGRDPEMRSTNDGTRIANLSLATSESWKDRTSGERKERTEWHRIVIFDDKLAEIAEKYLRKGAKIYISGALQTRKWTDNAGVEKYSTDVVLQKFRGELTMLDAAGGGGGNRPSPAEESDYGGRSNSTSGGSSRTTRDNDLDSEIPFATSEMAAEPYLKRRIVA